MDSPRTNPERDEQRKSDIILPYPVSIYILVSQGFGSCNEGTWTSPIKRHIARKQRLALLLRHLYLGCLRLEQN